MAGYFQELRAELTMDADGVSQGVSEAERSLGGLKTAMGAAGVAAGALAAGGLAASVQAASQLQTEMTELEKVAGAETMRAMKSEIREMSKTIPLAQTELTQLTSDAARFGIRGPENLRSFTESVAKLSTATDLAATEAGESMAKLAQLTGTPIPKVENLGSSINSVSNTAATSSSEIVDSMLRSAGALSQMGLTQTEIVGLSGTLNEVSESSERAGTRLRRLSQELTNPKKVDNLSAALGLTSDEFKNMRSNAPVKLIQQMATEMKQGGDAADLLRKNLSTTSRQALSALGQNLEGLNKNLKTSRTEFKKNTSLQKEFNAASDTFNNKVQLLKNSIMALAVSVGNNLLPYLSPLVERLSRLVTRFTAWSESMGGLPATIGLVATAITGLVGGGALLASQLGIAASASTALGAALGVLTGPIGLVVLAVAGLAAAFATNFGGIRDQTMRVVSVLQAELQPAIEWLRSDGVSIFNQIKSAVGAFVTFVEPYFAKVISLIADGLIVYIRTLATVWSAVFNTIETVVTTVWNSVLRPFITWLTSFWGNQNGQLMADISETWTVIQNTISDFVVWARPYIRSFATWVVARWRQMWQIVEPLFDAHLSNIVAIVKFGLGSIRRGIEFFADGIITTFRAFLAVIRGDWSEAWELMTGLFHRQVDRILSQARAFGKTIVTVFTNIGKGIIGVFRNLYQTLIGNSLIPDMFNDIVSYIKTTAKQRISGAIDQVIGSVKSAFSYMTGTGAGTLYGDVTGTLSSISSKAENWVSDFTQPFEDAKNDVERKFSNLKETLIGNSIVPDMLDDMVTEGEGWVGNFTSPFQDAKERVLSEFGKMKDGATDAASGIGETINEIAKKHGEFDDHAKKEVFSSLGNSDLKKLASSLTNLDYSHKKYESNPVRGNFGKAMSMLRETKRKGYTGTQFDNLLARSGDSGVYDLLERLHDFPHLDTGGKILKEGLYRGHPGERVLNPAETKRVDRGQHPDGGSGETYVTIDLGSLPEDAWVQADALADMALAKFDKRDERESRRL